MSSSSNNKSKNSVDTLLGKNTKGQIKETTYKTLANIGIGVIGGGLVTAVIGKPSFLLGLGLTGYSYYKDISWLSPLGIGMMASSNLLSNESNAGVSGFNMKQETENVKARVLNFKDSLLSKTYLDKVIKPKASSNTSAKRSFEASALEETTSGFGSVEENLNVLNQIEKQLVTSAMEIQNQRSERSTQRFNDEMNGIDEMDFSRL